MLGQRLRPGIMPVHVPCLTALLKSIRRIGTYDVDFQLAAKFQFDSAKYLTIIIEN